MTRNVGPLERKIRALAGILLVSAALFVEWPNVWEGIIGLAGAVLLATALTGYCPFNQLIGRRSRSTRASVYRGPERRHSIIDRRQGVPSRGARYLDRRDGPRDRRRYAGA